MAPSSILAEFRGPIVMIGFGSIGRGTLPLLPRHIGLDRRTFVIIDPDDSNRHLAEKEGLSFKKLAITRENYVKTLKPLLTGGAAQGLIVNLSVDVSSVDIMKLSMDIGS